VYRVVEKQIDAIAGNELVRMARTVELLRRVRAQGEARSVPLPVRPRGEAYPLSRSIGDHQRAQLAAVAGLLGPGVSDIELIDVGCETADSRCLPGIGIGLIRARTEPACVAQLRRQVEPYADARPGASQPGEGTTLTSKASPSVNLQRQVTSTKKLVPAADVRTVDSS